MAASLCGVHCNTAAYYFLRLREIIACELEAESEAMFGGEIEVDECHFGGKRKGKRGRGAAGATLIPIIERKVVARIASFIPTAGAAVMCWMCRTSITSVSTILSSSQTATITSMALRISGIRPSATCVNSTVFPSRILGYSCRNASRNLTKVTLQLSYCN